MGELVAGTRVEWSSYPRKWAITQSVSSPHKAPMVSVLIDRMIPQYRRLLISRPPPPSIKVLFILPHAIGQKLRRSEIGDTHVRTIQSSIPPTFFTKFFPSVLAFCIYRNTYNDMILYTSLTIHSQYLQEPFL